MKKSKVNKQAGDWIEMMRKREVANKAPAMGAPLTETITLTQHLTADRDNWKLRATELYDELVDAKARARACRDIVHKVSQYSNDMHLRFTEAHHLQIILAEAGKLDKNGMT